LRGNPRDSKAILFVQKFFNIFDKYKKYLEIIKKDIIQQGIKSRKLATFSIDAKATDFYNLIYQVKGSSKFFTLDSSW